jgi:PST family polysaccharide transporter
MGIFSTITTVSATVLGIVFFKSLTLTALCISVAYALNFVIVYYVLIDRLLKEDFLVFVKTIIQHGTMGVVLILLLYASQFLFDLSGSSITIIWSILVKIVITGAVFIAFHFSIFKDLAKRFLPKK